MVIPIVAKIFIYGMKISRIIAVGCSYYSRNGCLAVLIEVNGYKKCSYIIRKAL